MPNIAVPKLLRRQEYRFVNAQGLTDSILYEERDRAYRYAYKYNGQGKPIQILVLDSTYRRPSFDTLSFTAVTYNAAGRMVELYQLYAFPNGNSMAREKFVYDGSGRLVEALQYSWAGDGREADHPLQQHLYFYGTETDKQTAARKISRPSLRSLSVPKPMVRKPASPVKPSKEVFRFVEQMPEFPGDLQDYLNKHLSYPTAARKKGVEGRVVLQFIVETNGSIRDVKVVRSAAPELDAEAVRVVKAMPAWISGKQNGRRVAVYMNVPVTFRLE
jgi:TonB family protein